MSSATYITIYKSKICYNLSNSLLHIYINSCFYNSFTTMYIYTIKLQFSRLYQFPQKSLFSFLKMILGKSKLILILSRCIL